MKALVIGGARSGYGAAYLLHKQGYQVVLVCNQDFDQRQALEAMGVEVVLDDSETDRFDHVDLVVKNPGIPGSHPLARRFNCVNEIEIAAKANQSARIFAVSGTNGKTTTVSLLDAMLKKKDQHAILAGNIGYPYSEIVAKNGDQAVDVALELSAFQMEDLPELQLNAYALLNLTPDHLDRYETVDDYYGVKTNFASHATVFVRNFDDENILRLTSNSAVDTIDVSLKTRKDVYIAGNDCFYHSHLLFSLSALKLVGKHNLMNAMFAGTLAFLAGCTSEHIESALKEFSGVEHRIEYVEELKGVRYYNDSKATNPESTEVALQAFDDHPIILLAGGYDKKIPFDKLKKYEHKLKAVFVFGDSAHMLKETFPFAVVVEDMKEALERAHTVAKQGDVVLLSPACASYDQFKDFEDRGRQFKALVHELAHALNNTQR